MGKLDREQLDVDERRIVQAVNAPYGDARDWDAIRAGAHTIADVLRVATPSFAGVRT